ncbi:metallophosphoesterase family protein [Pseudothermotoga sp.]|nr:exonuclease SbcCD subunit D [Pseudothermotoga sp.]MCX7813636.1 exonuclease SbcCD subunit D [Pseudothermotoga sp.]MDW8139960.1 exonuclease SbcCD subunit D [Pseudothermotoga sp.]
MKILHTSDWHIGLQSWTGSKPIDRLEELRASLFYLVKVAEEERVDLVLIVGDVLHSRVSPRIDALDLLSEVISRFSSIAPTFLLFGNHDWQGLSCWKNFQLKNVHIVERPKKIELNEAVLFFLPYTDYQKLLGSAKDPIAAMREFLDSYVIEFRNQIEPSKTNILVAHAMVEGCFESERENAIQYELKRNSFPSGFDYVALGHVHNQLLLLQSPVAWYCGSPIALDFGEEKDVKGALLVEISNRTQVRSIRTPHMPLKTFEYNDYSLSNLNELESQLNDFSGYARVIFKCLPSNEVRRHLLEKYPNVVKVEFEAVWQDQKIEVPEQKKSLIEMYRDYIKQKYPEHERQMIEIVQELLKEVEQTETSQD